VRLGKPGAQAAEDGHVPARHQPRFRARLFLQGHLPEAGRVVQPGGQQHVAQDVQQVGGLGDHRLAMQEQPGGGRVAAAPDRRDQRGRRDAARLAPDALRQLDEILGLGAHLQQGPAKQRHIRQQILRQGVEVKAQVEVDDAVGEQIVVEQLPLAQRQMLNRDAPDVPVEVGQRQGGDGRQRLRRVGRLLDAAQFLRVGDHGLEVGLAHGGAGCGQTGLLRRLALGAGAWVRDQGDRRAVRVIQQVAGDQLLKVTPGGDAGLDPLQRRLEGQRVQRIAAVQPDGQHADHQRQPAREAAGVSLPQLEFDRVHGSLDHLRIDAVAGQGGQRVHDQGLDLIHIGGVDALETSREVHLALVGADAAIGQVFAQAGVDQGLAQRGGRRVDQNVRQDVQGQPLLDIDRLRQQPAHRDHAAPLSGLFPGVVAHRSPARRGEARLERDGIVDLDALETGDEGVDQAQALLRVVVPIEPDAGIGGMVVGIVEGLELLIGQVGHDHRVTTGVEAVRPVGQDVLLSVAAQQVIRRGVRALHLVEDDAPVGQRAIRRFQLVVPAFLLERLLADAGEEDRIQVDIDQVVEVLEVGAGDRVAGHVRVGHGVEKSVERAFEQLDERLLDRVLAGAAQHGMLHDVRHAGRIGGRGLEGHAEDLVLVVILQGKQLRPGAEVAEAPGARVDLRDVAFFNQFKTVYDCHEGISLQQTIRQAARCTGTRGQDGSAGAGTGANPS